MGEGFQKKTMIPNLGGLMLTSTTGVTTHRDGSRTFTAEELATLTQLLGPVPALMPAPAPAPSRIRRRPARMLPDDSDSSSSSSSSSEGDRPPPAHRRRSPAPPAQRRSRTAEPHDTRPRTMPELLKADDLATILGAIGDRDQSKRSACKEAGIWCNLNTEHQEACDGAIPDVWRDLAKRIFNTPWAKWLPNQVTPDGDNLIYLAYRDDDDPRKAFNGMCHALALGDVLAKLFAVWALDKYMAMLQAEEHQGQFTEEQEWRDNASRLFRTAPLSGVCKNMYAEKGDNAFKSIVDVVFSTTAAYLFEGDKNFKNLAPEVEELPRSDSEDSEDSEGSSYGSDDEPDDRYGIGQEDAIYAIGEALGVYIMGLWKLQCNLTEWQDKYKGQAELMAPAVYVAREKEKKDQITGIRVQIAHAVDRVLWGPNAMVPTEYAEYNTFQEQLHHDEDVVNTFDMFEDEEESEGEGDDVGDWRDDANFDYYQAVML